MKKALAAPLPLLIIHDKGKDITKKVSSIPPPHIYVCVVVVELLKFKLSL